MIPRRSKVLVIDDQPEVATLTGNLLRRVGFEVAIAKGALEAIHLAQNDEFDLVTVDIDLPGMNGFEVCAWLKQDFRFNRTPIIFVSGRVDDESRWRALNTGAADFIAKPFDPFSFISRILCHVKPNQ